MGQVLTAGAGQNPARQASIKAGMPNMVPALTINKVCGSGLKATHLAAQAIKCGDADIVIAGGQENMSPSAHVLPGSRDGFRMGDTKLVDTMIVDGLWDVYNHYHMGVTAENVAKEYGISRAAQDAFALHPAEGRGGAESRQLQGRDHPARDPVQKVATVFDTDEYPKHGTTLRRWRPASGLQQGRHSHRRQCLGHQRWRRRHHHDVGPKAKELGLKPLARIKAYSSPASTRRSWAWARYRPPSCA